ncbi:MAG TPA: TatD family hydrolase [Candidatus Methylomirabilis sp.]|nr:TatD family hydrolase [Candidatus Methylomirabilis sp.]
MAPRLIDSHCHLHFPAYNEDRDAVLKRMRERDVWGITVGTNAATSKSAIAFAEAHSDIFATVGYHPEHLTSAYHDESEGHDDAPYTIGAIADLAGSSNKVVAIGETGLDFYRIDEDRELEDAAQQQEHALRDHIALAHNMGLPLVIHCRDAFMRLATIIQDEQGNGRRVHGVVHCFTGSWDEAVPLLDLGLHLSFTGIITFPVKKNGQYPHKSPRIVVEKMPLQRLLVETDAPWLTPVPHRGKKNEPAYVEFIAEAVARIRNTDLHAIARQSVENTVDLFKLQ